MNDEIIIRCAEVNDADALLEIYAPYVANTAISFEYEVPTKDEFIKRIENTLKKYPYIVAEKDGEIVGYAYTGAFKSRQAYDHSVETTIYIKEDCKKCGIGRRLYSALEKISLSQNVFNMNACIGYPENDDEHLTKNSAQFHEHIGYTTVGRFHKCGYKFGKWYDMIWMEKFIGEHTSSPATFIPFSDLDLNTILPL